MSHSTPVLAGNRPVRQQAIARNRYRAGAASLHVANIEAVLLSADETEWADGLAWYPAANEIASVVGGRLFQNDHAATVKGAAIVAALSPQTSWDENVVRALAFSRGDSVGGLGDGLAKAQAIVAGQSPATVLGGRKVRSFWHNICGNGAAVTIDRHAAAIAVGHPLSDAYVKCLERIGCYAQVAAAYRTVARKTNLQACEVQAITWLAWRRAKKESV